MTVIGGQPGAFGLAVAIAVAAAPAFAVEPLSRNCPPEGAIRISAMTPPGLTILPSQFGPEETMDRLAAAVTERGLSILARIDHAAAAAQVGLELRPTALLIFGNARAGTPLMQLQQTVGIDLPLKALVWQDQGGRTWVAGNDPEWIAERHGLDRGGKAVEAMREGLAALLRLGAGSTP